MVYSFINCVCVCQVSVKFLWTVQALLFQMSKSRAAGQTNLHKPHSRTYGSLRWPWSCEFPDTLLSRDANHRKVQAVFWRWQTFHGTAKICHLYMDLGSGAKHRGGEIQVVFLLLCPGSPPSVQRADTVDSSACCLWPAAMSTLSWGSAANLCLDSHQAQVTGFVCFPVPLYLMWPDGDEKLHWGSLCIARIRVVFAFGGEGRRPADEFVRQYVMQCPSCSYSHRKHWDAWPKGMT